MKISEKLPQFKKEKVLIIVTGNHVADFYYAKDKEIEKIESIEITTPHYSDREGFFKTSGRGEVYETGSVYEPQKQEERKKFLKKLKETANHILKNNKITQVYIYSPDYILNEVKQNLPQSLKKKVKDTFEGNYHKTHPFKLLEKIK